MATATDLINAALADVGYSRWDDPQEGTKFGRWYAELTGSPYFGTSGVPFCAMAMSYWCDRAGVSSPVTPSAVAFDDRDDLQGRRVDKYDLQPGDLVAFDWDADLSGDHVGIVCERLGDGTYRTIEGNVDGGVVRVCLRYAYQIICGCRPWFDDAERPSGDGSVVVDGVCGPATVSAWQLALGTPVDGVIFGQDPSGDRFRPAVWAVEHGTGGSELVRVVQRAIGAVVDGHWGQETTNRLQGRLREWGLYDGEVDSVFGHHSVEALQASLNEGRWA